MRTIEQKIYTFQELSQEAKQYAHEKWNANNEYFWGNDAIKSLEKFLEHFNCSLSNYSIDWLGICGNTYKITIPEYMEEIPEEDLKNYILTMGEFDKETLKGLGDCKFTGYCTDEDAADGARKVYFNGERDLKTILEAGFNSWYKAVSEDAKYQFSMKGFAEDCDANNYEFYEDGDRY